MKIKRTKIMRVDETHLFLIEKKKAQIAEENYRNGKQAVLWVLIFIATLILVG